MTTAAVPAEPATQPPSLRPARDIEALFSPRSIAVFGASRNPSSVGHAIVRNLLLGGFNGIVSPINPNSRSLLGLRCYPAVQSLDERPDLAVVVLPAPAVEAAIVACADLGTRHFVVISAGFKEVGGEGAQREQRLGALAQERGLSILGPNCLGVINTAADVSMNASFGRDMPRPGPLGLVSQSGALCTALLEYAKHHGFGFSRFVSFGNKADLTEIDLLTALAADANTRAILMYVEDLSSGQGFIDAAHAITHGPNPKPILAIKTGRTLEGAAAAASHTGSLAGTDEVYEAIMQQAGVVRVESVADLFDHAEVFSDVLRPAGRGTAIVTNAGGPGIMATDACVRYGLSLAHFQEYTAKSLQFQLPPTCSIRNPVDVVGDARHDRYRTALDAVCGDENVHQVAVIITPQWMTDVDQIAGVIAETRGMANKPIVAVPMGLPPQSPAIALLRRAGVPVLGFPENALRAMAAKARFGEWVRSRAGEYRQFDVKRDAVAKLIDEELSAGRTHLTELRALEVLQHYGLPTVPFRLARSAAEAVAAADQLGWPVALKISSPAVLHKTEFGGVRLGLAGADAVRRAYDEMVSAVREKIGAEGEIWGVLVQKMLERGKETILGMTRDARLGPLLMFGLGGIYAEALHDVAFRLAPLRDDVPAQMIRSIRSYKLLEGVRKEPPSDVAAIGECLLRLSQLVTEHERIRELDVNPLIVYPRGRGAVVVDARIILQGGGS